MLCSTAMVIGHLDLESFYHWVRCRFRFLPMHTMQPSPLSCPHRMLQKTLLSKLHDMFGGRFCMACSFCSWIFFFASYDSCPLLLCFLWFLSISHKRPKWLRAVHPLLSFSIGFGVPFSHCIMLNETGIHSSLHTFTLSRLNAFDFYICQQHTPFPASF